MAGVAGRRVISRRLLGVKACLREKQESAREEEDRDRMRGRDRKTSKNEEDKRR